MSSLAEALMELRREDVLAEVGRRVEEGEDPLAILKECQDGMSLVGERFQTGEFFLSELLLSADIFKDASSTLKKTITAERPRDVLGKVVLATLRGDVHDLGKNIFGVLLEAHGFEVHDLGVDVAPEAVVAKVKEVRPDLVGYSALITTAFPAMKEATEALAAAGLRDDLKIMVGGGVTNEEVRGYADADFQTLDASAGVAYCLQVIAQEAEVG